MKFEASDLKFGVVPAFLKSLPAGGGRFRPCGVEQYFEYLLQQQNGVSSSTHDGNNGLLEDQLMIQRKEGKKGGQGLEPPLNT